MKRDPNIHIVMHSVLSLKLGVTGRLAGRGATRPHRVEQEAPRLAAALAARPPGKHRDPRSRSRTHKISVAWTRLIY